MSSNDGRCPPDLNLVTSLLAALNHDQLTLEVAGPIQLAMDTFQCTPMQVANQDEFLEIVGGFVQHLYWHGRLAPLRLSSMQAKSRALHLLEEQYEGVTASGYAGAGLASEQC